MTIGIDVVDINLTNVIETEVDALGHANVSVTLFVAVVEVDIVVPILNELEILMELATTNHNIDAGIADVVDVGRIEVNTPVA